MKDKSKSYNYLKAKWICRLSTKITFSILLVLVTLLNLQCKKEQDQLSPSKTVLSKNSPDFTKRLDNVKKIFYKKSLDKQLKNKVNQDMTWLPDWDNPKTEVVSDTVSYIFYPLICTLTKNEKKTKAKEMGSKSYLIVKNEQEFFKGIYYHPIGQLEIKESERMKEISLINFTGNLLLTNLEKKQSFTIDYVNGKTSASYNKKGADLLKKIGNNRALLSSTQTICHTEIRSCTYNTGCGGTLYIHYSENCMQPPSFAPGCSGQVVWDLSDWNEYEVCETHWFPDPPTDPGNGGTGSGENSGSNTIPENPYMPGQDHPAINPKDYVKCFRNIPDAGATYKVIVQVQEPVPGTSLNYGPINGVGHVAITLIKQGSNGLKVTQTIGFYPSGNSFKSPSKIVDNAKAGAKDNIDFTIRMTFDLEGNSADFNKILNKVANPPSDYDLLSSNCTTFVTNACSTGGITLPSATTYVITPGPVGVYSETPAGLGYNMRQAKKAGDNRVASGQPSTGENPTSNGPCN